MTLCLVLAWESLNWDATVEAASARARREEKLLVVIHTSGLFLSETLS